jgi:hypothetical protein
LDVFSAHADKTSTTFLPSLAWREFQQPARIGKGNGAYRSTYNSQNQPQPANTLSCIHRYFS